MRSDPDGNDAEVGVWIAPRQRHARRVCVGTAPMPGELHRQVHDRRRAGDRGHAGEGRTPAPTRPPTAKSTAAVPIHSFE